MARKRTKPKVLIVLLNGEFIGRVEKGSQGRLRFIYDDGYVQAGPGIPLSLSMPLIEREHAHEVVHAFLWGLLPDNDQVIRRWASKHHVSPTNVFGLIANVGEDCAGAVQFVSESRVPEIDQGERQPLSEDDIAGLLQELRRDPGLTRRPEDTGQFSLPGAQAKTALQYYNGCWYMPSGREPTTHILKPPRPDLDGYVENEHFCLRLAQEVGLRTAQTSIQNFGDEVSIVVERYDRVAQDISFLRVHQEDICQALAIHPSQKYENEGGPGIVQIMDLLNQSSVPLDDRHRFMAAIAFNYIILGSDAHAKNYSVLLGTGGRVRLAPLYDIASLLPYNPGRRDARFAMRLGRYYQDFSIQPRHFEDTARRAGYPPGEFIAEVQQFVEVIPNAAETILAELLLQGFDTPVLPKMIDALRERCKRLTKSFGNY